MIMIATPLRGTRTRQRTGGTGVDTWVKVGRGPGECKRLGDCAGVDVRWMCLAAAAAGDEVAAGRFERLYGALQRAGAATVADLDDEHVRGILAGRGYPVPQVRRRSRRALSAVASCRAAAVLVHVVRGDHKPGGLPVSLQAGALHGEARAARPADDSVTLAIDTPG
jgi:hypothetical protein